VGARQNLAPNAILRIPTNKGNKMNNRFRIEIYDENKNNDLTIYSEQGVDKEYLTEIVYSNITRFDGNVKAFVFDTIKKKKTTAMFLPMEIITSVKSKLNNTAKELHLA
jgi:hypothetical protein